LNLASSSSLSPKFGVCFLQASTSIPGGPGGDGFTPQAGVSLSAYYIATASFLQWSATLPCVQCWTFSTPPLFSQLDGTLRRADEPDIALPPLLASFLRVHQALLDRGVPRYLDPSDLEDARLHNSIPSPALFQLAGGPPFLSSPRSVTGRLMADYSPSSGAAGAIISGSGSSPPGSWQLHCGALSPRRVSESVFDPFPPSEDPKPTAALAILSDGGHQRSPL